MLWQHAYLQEVRFPDMLGKALDSPSFIPKRTVKRKITQKLGERHRDYALSALSIPSLFGLVTGYFVA